MVADDFVEVRELLDSARMARTLRRLADEIVEGGTGEVALVGIHTGGVHLAKRLHGLIRQSESADIPLGRVDITLYRDDVPGGLPKPIVGATDLPFDVSNKVIVLVDDVLYTGRTVRAALDALTEFGRPKGVRLAVLVDRGHREFPIQADLVGLRLETKATESVRVMLTERGETDRVVLRAKREASNSL